MSRPVVVYLGPAHAAAAARQALGDAADLLIIEPDAAAVAKALPAASAVLDASMRVSLSRAVLEAAPHLRVVSTATTGADHIDRQALDDRGIPLLTLAGQSDLLRQLTPAAEHSWLLLLACARRLRGAVEHVLAGDWDRTQFPGLMLKGATLGLVGCGRIGRQMARYAEAFEMEVLGYDPFVDSLPTTVRAANLEEVCGSAQAVSVHVPLNGQTRHLIGSAQFALMRDGVVFVNTSRGAVADEQALLEALRSGKVGAAGLDVLEGEPQVREHPLRLYALEHPNVIITPHIGGFSPAAVSLAVAHAARRALDVLREGS